MNPVAGWYDDPADSERIRYWDGVAWTPYTQPTPEPTHEEGSSAYPAPLTPDGKAESPADAGSYADAGAYADVAPSGEGGLVEGIAEGLGGIAEGIGGLFDGF